MAIIDPPTPFRRARLALSARDTIATVTGTYDAAVSRLDYGGDAWALSVTTPALPYGEAAWIAAFVDQARRPGDTARIYVDPIAWRHGTTTAQSVTLSAPVVAGDQQISVSGLGAGATLGPGSLVSIGDRLYRTLWWMTGDAATTDIFPRIRDGVPAGTTVVLRDGISGLWVPTSRPALEREPSRLGALVAPMTLEFVEAL